MHEHTVFTGGLKQKRLLTKDVRKEVGQGNKKKRQFQVTMQTPADVFTRDIKGS